ncbi:hypothetical protein [Salinarimonas soli]|uniref:Uncharacterized protein n=1 Tax=Salinarimonas soli TaxID=1638099 RepID=A0A5B2VGH5_9HYPH|nr:hypothetical protein [Salinarimonas soli]KAA2237656.1 hypothetical protein F0L46_08220 [Salinarimonas soli]
MAKVAARIRVPGPQGPAAKIKPEDIPPELVAAAVASLVAPLVARADALAREVEGLTPGGFDRSRPRNFTLSLLLLGA